MTTSKFSVIAFTFALLSIGTLGAAHAKQKAARIKVNIKNCSGVSSALHVKSFNGRDSSRTYPKKKIAVRGHTTGSVSCRGQGTGKCWITIKRDADHEKQRKVAKNKWVMVTMSGTQMALTISNSEMACPVKPADVPDSSHWN